MPIINCQECNGKLSTLAPNCPHCGMPAAKTVELPKQAVPNFAPKAIIQSSTPENVNKKVALKMAGAVLILIGAAVIIYQIVNPSAAQLGQIHRDMTAGGSGSTATNTLVYLPSFIMFLIGGGLWKAGS